MNLTLLYSILPDQGKNKEDCSFMCEHTAKEIINHLYDNRPLYDRQGWKGYRTPPHSINMIYETSSLFNNIESELKLTDVIMLSVQNGTLDPNKNYSKKRDKNE